MGAMLINLLLNVASVMATGLAHVGLALSTAVAAWINVGLLYATLRRRGHFHVDARLKRRGIRLLMATGAMTALLLAIDPLIDPYLSGGFGPRVVGLSVLIGLASLCYFGCAFLFGAFRIADLKAQLRRRRA